MRTSEEAHAREVMALALEAAARIADVEGRLRDAEVSRQRAWNENGRLRDLLRDAIANLDPDTCGDYQIWKDAANGVGR